jgi:CubicO group peptidase (beta-lactamase class C family)
VPRLVADGRSNPAIGSAMFVSVATVRTHVSHILAKLGPESRLWPRRPGQNKLATGCTEADLLAAGASAPPVAPPGTKWAYSDYGYDLLGRVVELVTGQDVSTAIQQRIAGPLGLHRTSFPRRGMA